MDDVLTFYPGKYTFTVKKIWVQAIPIFVFCLAGIFLILINIRPKQYFSFIVISLVIFFVPWIQTLTKKYPLLITIDKKKRSFEVLYLAAFGKKKNIVINIDKAVVKYENYHGDPTNKRQGYKYRDTLKIYDNVWNNWFKMYDFGGFQKEQVISIYETLVSMKEP